MIEARHELSNENGYVKYSHFEISETLKDILKDEYHLYNSSEFKYQELAEDLYKKNFYDKYNRETQPEVFQLYIDNKSFKDKAKFIYSIIDFKKYSQFVSQNSELENPNDFTIAYSILDSHGTKIEVYTINIVDISFVF